MKFLAQQEFRARVQELQKSNLSNKDQVLFKVKEINVQEEPYMDKFEDSKNKIINVNTKLKLKKLIINEECWQVIFSLKILRKSM